MRFAKRAGAIICTIILAVTFCFGTTTAAAATQSEKSMNIRAINNDLPVPFSLNDYQVTQTIFYKGIMPSEKILDLPVDCNFLTGSVNL